MYRIYMVFHSNVPLLYVFSTIGLQYYYIFGRGSGSSKRLNHDVIRVDRHQTTVAATAFHFFFLHGLSGTISRARWIFTAARAK